MQIMPVTWTELRSRYRLGVDPYDPMTTSRLIQYTSVSSTIVTARRGSSPPTMQDLDATNVIWRPVGRHPTRPGVRRDARPDHRGQTD